MSATINTTVPRARTVDVAANVEVTLQRRRSGSVDIFLGGERALRITAKGHLRRFRGLTEAAGVRRLPDGRIAIKPAQEA